MKIARRKGVREEERERERETHTHTVIIVLGPADRVMQHKLNSADLGGDCVA